MKEVMKVIEECAELQKALCKAERFGWDRAPEHNPYRTNAMHVTEEIDDVLEAIARLRNVRSDV